ncbi:hypothetical protein NKG94_45430 [Micromonospora sp. M12]
MTADHGLSRRCTLVVGAAGYGKTVAVRGWLGDRPVRWCDAADVAELATTGLERLVSLGTRSALDLPVDEPSWLILDDVPRLPGTGYRRYWTASNTFRRSSGSCS